MRLLKAVVVAFLFSFVSCQHAVRTCAQGQSSANNPGGPVQGCGSFLNASQVGSGGVHSFTGSGVNGQVQSAILTIPAASLSVTSSSFQVKNSAFVHIAYLGAGPAGTISNLNCNITDNNGGTGPIPCLHAWLTMNVVDGTHVTVTASRSNCGDCSTTGLLVSIHVVDVNPPLVDSIQRGIGTTPSAAMTACPGGFNFGMLTFEGQSGQQPAGWINLQNNTTIGVNSGSAGEPIAYEVICWKTSLINP